MLAIQPAFSGIQKCSTPAEAELFIENNAIRGPVINIHDPKDGQIYLYYGNRDDLLRGHAHQQRIEASVVPVERKHLWQPLRVPMPSFFRHQKEEIRPTR